MQTQYSQEMNIPQQPLMGDIIEQLPSDQTVPSHNEIRIVDTLFKQKKSTFDRILQHTKNLLVMGALFILFSLPQVDALIKKIFTITATSQYILIGVKALMFMLVYFLIQNMYLARKN